MKKNVDESTSLTAHTARLHKFSCLVIYCTSVYLVKYIWHRSKKHRLPFYNTLLLWRLSANCQPVIKLSIVMMLWELTSVSRAWSVQTEKKIGEVVGLTTQCDVWKNLVRVRPLPAWKQPKGSSIIITLPVLDPATNYYCLTVISRWMVLKSGLHISTNPHNTGENLHWHKKTSVDQGALQLYINPRQNYFIT